MTQLYRTTKIPVFYFDEIEGYLSRSDRFVSVSEFIRDSIKEKLAKLQNAELEKKYFLLAKDIVFNEEIISLIHEKVLFKNNEKGFLKADKLQSIVNKSLDMNYINFISKFLVNFASIHPFNDGNKRTSWILVDVFLRLNNKKLELKAEKNKETKDEIFIWENSTSQRTIKQVRVFIENHIADYDENSEDVDIEIEKSIKENKLLLEKLSK